MTCSKLSPEQEFFTAIISRGTLMTENSDCNLFINYSQMKHKQASKNPNKTEQTNKKKPNQRHLNKQKTHQKNHKQTRKKSRY